MNMSSAPPEIETFKRRNIAIIPFLFSFGNIVFIWSTWSIHYYYPKIISAEVFIINMVILSLIHFIYTFVLLLAPRFLYRGMVWVKALPWIFSGAALLIVFFLMDEPTVFRTIYCVLGFILQSTQYTPFEKVMIPNLLAKIDLTHPNAGLETVYGAPVTIPSSIRGQRPAVIRYGSQAVRVQAPQNPINLQPAKSFDEFSMSPSSPSELPPAYSPPAYSAATGNSHGSASFYDKSRYDNKK